MMRVYVATLDTPHFNFITAGATEKDARRAMQRTWAAHRRQVLKGPGAAYVWTWAEVAEDVSVQKLVYGAGYRDGFALVKAKP